MLSRNGDFSTSSAFRSPSLRRIRRRITAACAASVVAAFVLASVSPHAHADTPQGKRDAKSKVQEAPLEKDSRAAVTFLTQDLTVWLGRSSIIPFEVDQADADADRALTVRVKGPVDVTMPPIVLANHKLGFVRVRPHAGLDQPTSATLRVGSGKLNLQLKPSPATHVNFHPPYITTPQSGAALWGRVGIGVELFDDPAIVDAAPREVFLEADTRRLKSVESSSLEHGPTRRFAFALDADSFGTGPLRLTPVVRDAQGHETRGQSIFVRVVNAPSSALWAFEAETFAQTPKPENMGGPAPARVIEDTNASGGKSVANYASRPHLGIPLQIDKPGWYQLIVLARGDTAAAMMPTVGVHLNEDPNAVTFAPVAATVYHRAAVGRPFQLTPEHTLLMPIFENDASYGRGHDRNLVLDRLELLRLDIPPHHRPTLPGLDHQTQNRHVAFDDLIQGRHLTGDLELAVRTNAGDPRKPDYAPPKVTLLLNEKPVASLTSGRPRFIVPASMLRSGQHTLALQALYPGQTEPVQSVTQTITYHAAAAPAPDTSAEPPPTFRFYVDDPAWNPGGGFYQHDRNSWWDRTLFFASNAEAQLTLPRDLQGQFNLSLDARADLHEGPPIARVTLEQGGSVQELGDIEVKHRHFSRFTLPDIDFAPGPKVLRIAFINDRYDGSEKKDRNLHLRSISLDTETIADITPPAGLVLYPTPGTQVAQADAVVLQLTDDRSVRTAELLVDGQPTGVITTLEPSTGRALLRWSLRNVKPGTHTIAARLTDAAKHTADTPAVSIDVLPDDYVGDTAYRRAVHLLDRFAFGAAPSELADALVLGPNAYLRDRLIRTADHPAHRAAVERADVAYAQRSSGYHVVMRGLMLPTAGLNPVRARFTMFAENHFNTWLRKTGGGRKAQEHLRFARLGVAPFADLLLTSATSPAMIHYLDQQQSRGNRINENYAREIMELHTLGVHGGYEQNDVTQLANVFPGWTYAEAMRNQPSQFRFIPQMAQNQPRRVFGLRIPEAKPELRFSRAMLPIEMLAAHPATARFISTKLAEHYTQAPADPLLVDDLTQVFLRTGGDLREVLLTLGTHDTFWASRSQPRFTKPAEFALRLMRKTGTADPGAMHAFLQSSGHQLFDRETPDGYPEADADYADSNSILQRWKFAHSQRNQLAALLPGSLRQLPEDVDQRPAWRQAVIDQLALSLTDSPLSAQTYEAAERLLAELEDLPKDEAIKTLAAFIAQCPEAQMR